MRYAISRVAFMGVVSVVVLACETVQAETYTLAQLVADPNITITAGDKAMYGWQVLDSGNLAVDLSQVTVMGLEDGPDYGIGIAGNGALTATGSQTRWLTIGYFVTALDPLKQIFRSSLELTSYVADDAWDAGVIDILGPVYDPDNTTSPLDNTHVWADPYGIGGVGSYRPSDLISFAPQAELIAFADIWMEGGFAANILEIGMIEQRFVQTPEPATLFNIVALAGIGLVCVWRRRKVA